jgi:DNA-binding response OmpR family regulator
VKLAYRTTAITSKEDYKDMSDSGRQVNTIPTARVMLIDDTPSELYRLEIILKSLGFTTICCDKPSNALQILLVKHVDIVICDWQMPSMSGLAVCESVSQSPAMGDPYFIMLTGRCDRSDMIEAIDAGADDFICKPAARDELRARLQAGLRRLDRERALSNNLRFA